MSCASPILVECPGFLDQNALLDAATFRFPGYFLRNSWHHLGVYLAGTRTGCSSSAPAGLARVEPVLFPSLVCLCDRIGALVFFARPQPSKIHGE